MFTGAFEHIRALGPVGVALVISIAVLSYWVLMFWYGFRSETSREDLRRLHQSCVGRCLEWWGCVGLFHLGVLGTVGALYFPGFKMDQSNLDQAVSLYGSAFPPAMGTTMLGLAGLLIFSPAFLWINAKLEV